MHRRLHCASNPLLLGLLWGISILLALAGGYFAASYFRLAPAPFERAFVTIALDGDTIQRDGGEIVRYIGIDTPETMHPDKPVECFGHEATDRNRQLVEGKYVELMRGTEDRDQYGRLLRYVFVDGVFVNAELITEGYARQYGYGVERRFQQVFVQLEQYSIGRKNGLWGACPQE